LIDQKVCRFEGICVYTPERLRTNDTVYLQLRCYILKASFQNGMLNMASNRSTGLFEEQETSEERDLRLRQVALVRLFQAVDLLPSKAAATNSRQGLLQAAEAAEQKEKEAAKSSNQR
jgi:DNA repair protein RAD5